MLPTMCLPGILMTADEKYLLAAVDKFVGIYKMTR
jgi:hypothetical protein